MSDLSTAKDAHVENKGSGAPVNLFIAPHVKIRDS